MVDRQLFVYHNISVQRSRIGQRADAAIEEMLGAEAYECDLYLDNMTMWSRYRPDDEGDHIEVEHWTLETAR